MGESRRTYTDSFSLKKWYYRRVGNMLLSNPDFTVFLDISNCNIYQKTESLAILLNNPGFLVAWIQFRLV